MTCLAPGQHSVPLLFFGLLGQAPSVSCRPGAEGTRFRLHPARTAVRRACLRMCLCTVLGPTPAILPTSSPGSGENVVKAPVPGPEKEEGGPATPGTFASCFEPSPSRQGGQGAPSTWGAQEAWKMHEVKHSGAFGSCHSSLWSRRQGMGYVSLTHFLQVGALFSGATLSLHRGPSCSPGGGCRSGCHPHVPPAPSIGHSSSEEEKGSPCRALSMLQALWKCPSVGHYRHLQARNL